MSGKCPLGQQDRPLTQATTDGAHVDCIIAFAPWSLGGLAKMAPLSFFTANSQCFSGKTT